MTIKEQLPFLANVAKGVASLFGENCEVTVHDLSAGYESTVVHIENGHVTGRQLGDGASEKVLRALRDDHENVQDQYSYLARTKDGRVVKSSSIYIRDESGKVNGLFGINYDITDLTMAQRALDTALAVGQPEENSNIETIATNVTDLLDQLIEEADGSVGKPVAMMTKDDKTHAIQYLNERGAFLIKKAGDKVSKHYDISKYTLYNYMDAET